MEGIVDGVWLMEGHCLNVGFISLSLTETVHISVSAKFTQHEQETNN